MTEIHNRGLLNKESPGPGSRNYKNKSYFTKRVCHWYLRVQRHFSGLRLMEGTKKAASTRFAAERTRYKALSGLLSKYSLGSDLMILGIANTANDFNPRPHVGSDAEFGQKGECTFLKQPNFAISSDKQRTIFPHLTNICKILVSILVRTHGKIVCTTPSH